MLVPTGLLLWALELSEENLCNYVVQGVWDWTFRSEYVQSQETKFLSCLRRGLVLKKARANIENTI